MNARLLLASIGWAAASAHAQQTSVVFTPHNLSSGGPGQVRATSENEVCIFCHAPHNSSPVRPLWNRAMPTESYTIYTSRAMTATPGQPTGMSKMCLSCHDGTIAIGSVISRQTPIAMAGGVSTIPDGPSRLGTDLSDDHPVSFRYDTSTAAHNQKVRSPSALPPEIRLDGNSELQCTSCHNAHNNAFGKFLVKRNENSELCTSCHQMGQTNISAHQNCSECHQPHTAPSGPYLLKRATISETCNACHNGTVPGAANIASELQKPSHHDTASPVDPPGALTDHATCASCHEPHTMMSGKSQAPRVPPNFGALAGVSSSGASLKAASYEYEVCFTCHADRGTGQAWLTRVIEERNVRSQFSPSGVSYHPVVAAGRSSDVPSLIPGWTTASRMSCSDCHGSDNPGDGAGLQPKGLHGSMFAPNLIQRYETRDYTSENAQNYALCYKCHDRGSILDDRSFKGHRKHVVEYRAPCAACHDAHGISSKAGRADRNTHLINFATSIVRTTRAGRLEYIDLGSHSGQCFLSCHNKEHTGERYP